ncbi:MAG: MotE family protein [Bacteriovoracia bacterium]
MKYFILVLVTLFINTSYAQNAKPAKASKTYSEEEFTKKVAEEVRRQVDNVKNKSVSELTKELVTKEETLRLRELDLEKRQDQLKVSSQDLEKKIKDFNAEQNAVLGCLQKNEEDAKNRVSQQVEVVSNMQPAKAALLLSVQEADIAVQILQLLDPKKASKIFNLMDKEVSARLQKQYMNMKR